YLNKRITIIYSVYLKFQIHKLNKFSNFLIRFIIPPRYFHPFRLVSDEFLLLLLISFLRRIFIESIPACLLRKIVSSILPDDHTGADKCTPKRQNRYCYSMRKIRIAGTLLALLVFYNLSFGQD